MDVKQLRSTLVDIYARTLGKTIDSKTLGYQVSSITRGENTIKNVINTLINTTEYHERIKSMYSILYFDIVGVNPTDEQFELFWNSVKIAGDIIDANVIETYVRHTPAFRNKYTGLINEVYNTLNNTTPSDEIVNMYLEKLMDNNEYDYNHLKSDIENEALQNKALAPKNDILTNGDRKDVQVQVTTLESSVSKLETELLAKFEEVFDRPMYVVEYFKYIVNPTEQRRNEIFSSLQDLKQQHASLYNRLANIYITYANTPLSEHTYINIHLLKVDETDYFDTVINSIVQTKEYEENALVILQSYYKKIYDLTMDDTDLRYIFNIVKNERLHLRDERIVELLKSFKQQTDDIIDHIFATFEKVLERQPDMYEIEEQVSTYRHLIRSKTFQDINTSLSKSLAQTLEFHDIIKKHIKTVYVSMKNKEISPSILFNVLQKVLNVDNVTIDNVDHVIQQFIA